MPVDDFKIVFMEEQTKEVVKEVTVYRSSGGGSYTRYVDRDVIEFVEVEVERIVNNTIEVEVEKEVPSEIGEKQKKRILLKLFL